MVTVAYGASFERAIRTIRDATMKERLKAQIIRIVNNPETGKPMRYGQKHTREVYISPYRLSYCYDREKDLLVFLALYHRNQQ